MRVHLDGVVTVDIFGDLGMVQAAGVGEVTIAGRGSVEINVNEVVHVPSMEAAQAYHQREMWYHSNGQIESVDIQILEV